MDPADDYPEFALGVAEGVTRELGSLGVVFCRSAGGAVIAANKVKGVRAVAAQTEDQAIHARQHNDAQVLGIGGDVVTQDAAVKIVEKFVTTPFTNEERHTRRLQKIAAYEDAHE
jgi:ribose 5-phosphate isomerase B